MHSGQSLCAQCLASLSVHSPLSRDFIVLFIVLYSLTIAQDAQNPLLHYSHKTISLLSLGPQLSGISRSLEYPLQVFTLLHGNITKYDILSGWPDTWSIINLHDIKTTLQKRTTYLEAGLLLCHTHQDYTTLNLVYKTIMHLPAAPTRCSSIRTLMSTILAFVLLAPLTTAHSWIEEYQVISDNGSFTGPRGYSRGYVSRTDPTYNGFSMMWMLPSLDARNSDGTVRTRINNTDSLCHPAQRTSNYTATFPKLKVAPGDYVAMKYLENGHVSLPWNITGKPPGGGSVFIFGTTKPSDDEKIADVMQWNRAGTGGNGNGWLMTAQNFDDGRCHQINCGSISQQRQILQPNHVAEQPTSTVESWCENDLLIPKNVTAGTLTTYWIWQFGTEPNMDCNTPAGKDEYYTTCADFDVVDSSEMQKVAAEPAQSVPAAESNPQSVAVSDYKSRTAYTTSPSVILMNNGKISGPVTSVNSAFVSSCSAQASVISAASLGLWPEVYVPNSCEVISSFGTAAASANAATFDSAAASYTSGAESAYSVAFKAAGMAVPVRSPWSYSAVASTAAPAYTSAASPTGYESSSASTSSEAPVTSMPASSSTPAAGAGQSMTTVITVVTLTETLPINPSSSAMAPSAYSSSVAASLVPSAYSSSTSETTSSTPLATAYSPSSIPSSSVTASAYSSSSSSSLGGVIVSIPTISTVSGYAPIVAYNASATASVYKRSESGTRRSHPRNWFFGGQL